MSSLLLLQVLLLFVISQTYCSQECPPVLPSKTCECIGTYGKIFLSCIGTGDAELNATLTALDGRVLTALYIKNSTIRSIPYKPLRNLSILRIQIIDSTLFYLFDRPLEGSVAKSLTSAKLTNVDFELGLDWALFEDATALKEVVVSACDIERVSEPLEILGKQLETLELSDANLEYLYPKAFTGLTNLQNLLLKNNFLQVFSREMLPLPSSNIQFLDLSNNQLESFPKDVFDDLPKLHSLLLHGNSFKVLEKVYMQKIWNQLFFFNARDNPLQCGCELSWIAVGERPIHLFGDCIELGTGAVKNLKELAAKDFHSCY